MTLGLDAHVAFDEFSWSLEEMKDVSDCRLRVHILTDRMSQVPAPAPNTYKVVVQDWATLGLLVAPHDTITFEDHSMPSSQPLKKLRTTRSGEAGSVVAEQGVPLPNPQFIRIHHAIAGILHMSGAGKAIDDAIERMGGAGSSGTVTIGDDFYDMFLAEH
jgi:hypothetical protein